VFVAGWKIPAISMQYHPIHKVQGLTRREGISTGLIRGLEFPRLGLGPTPHEVLDTEGVVSEESIGPNVP
jgi:hypothetical protein